MLGMASVFAAAQNEAPKVEVSFNKGEMCAKGTASGVITVTLKEGMHAYQNPPTKDYQIPLTLKIDGKDFKLTPTFPKGVVKEFLGETTALYEGIVKIPFKLKLPSKVGDHTVKFSLGYQLCNDEACFPPGTVSVSKKLKVVKGTKNGG